MKRLNHREWKNLFSALSILHSDIEPETLGERCVTAANCLVASDITTFDFFTDAGVHAGKFWYDPPDAISQSDYEIFVHVAHEHPFVPDVFAKKRRDAMKTSDFFTPGQFHRTAIYNEFFSRCRVENQLLAAFSDAPDSVVTFNFSRAKSDFSEAERLIVNLMKRHLQTAFLNAHKIERFYRTESNLSSVLESKSSGVIVLDADRKIVYQSEFARRMLEKYFANEKTAGGALPNDLGRWLTNESDKLTGDKISPPTQSFELDKENEKLEISLMRNVETSETTLLIEESRGFCAEMLKGLNLTRRETEILFWIARGKTNKDIGVLLGISPRTVNKHADNIYLKLGVENRTAAVNRAIETLGINLENGKPAPRQ